ncbi:M1 family metallopeptidase [Nitrospira sp. Nam80]
MVRSAVQEPTFSRHELSVELRPDSHELIATDRLIVQNPDSRQAISFSLASSLQIDGITATPLADLSAGAGQAIPFRRDVPKGDHVTIQLPESRAEWVLECRYRGTINDPPREPRHLRFVTPSETAGHIGPEGVYLSSESKWYPDLPGSLASYELDVTAPAGWVAISQGAGSDDGGRWSVTVQSEALTLVANRFTVSTRDWQASNGRTIRLSTYLFPEDAHLAQEYLDASERYLEAYIPLLGPYPFPKFAVVENFFSSGLGMPSFTLLGAAVIKRHYTQPYALGHEIVHSWIGNGVYNRTNQGNWVEGLTTYLANYYYHELLGDEARAREQRRLMLFGYAVYVPPGRDYPVARFSQKTDERDNAIGYQKTAMVFHMLRRELGDAAFWSSLKALIAEHMGAYADWNDIERAFGIRNGRDLRWFFEQWVERPGAPRVVIAEAKLRKQDDSVSPPGRFLLSATLVQQGVPYRIPVDLQVNMVSQAPAMKRVEISDAWQTFTIPVAIPAHDVILDPDFHLFRRLERHELPAMLNLFVTDPARTIKAATTMNGENATPFSGIIQRVRSQEGTKPEPERTRIADSSGKETRDHPGSILLLGYDDDEAKLLVRESCGDRFEATPAGFKVAGTAYEGLSAALLISCPRRGAPGSVVSLLHGMTPEAVSKVARLLFFYGWNSYVIFKDGIVMARGDWDMDMKREVDIE